MPHPAAYSVGDRQGRAVGRSSPAARRDRVLKALAERNKIDKGSRRHGIWGTAPQVGQQGGDLGRMSALDAGYDVRSSGITIDRFCGSGISAVNFAAACIMSGMEDRRRRRHRNDVDDRPPRRPDDHGQRQYAPAPASSADAPGRLRRRHRHDGRHFAQEALDEAGYISQQRADVAIKEGRFQEVHRSRIQGRRTLALDHDEYPRPQTTREGLAALKAAFLRSPMRRSTTRARPISA